MLVSLEQPPGLLCSKWEKAENSSTCGSAAASHQWTQTCGCIHTQHLCVWIHLYICVTILESVVCECVCVHWAKVKLTWIPANCFSSILQDLVGKDPLPLCCRLSASAASLSLSLSGMDSSVSCYQKFFGGGWGFARVSSPLSLCLGPQLLPLLCCFASVAWVASLLCVNSALIQKLFYAVKRTCDRQRGVEGGEECGGENTF